MPPTTQGGRDRTVTFEDQIGVHAMLSRRRSHGGARRQSLVDDPLALLNAPAAPLTLDQSHLVSTKSSGGHLSRYKCVRTGGRQITLTPRRHHRIDLPPFGGARVRIPSSAPDNLRTWEACKRRIFRRFLLFGALCRNSRAAISFQTQEGADRRPPHLHAMLLYLPQVNSAPRFSGMRSHMAIRSRR